MTFMVTAILRRLRLSVGFRTILTLVLVGTFLLYPWTVSGPVAYDSSDPRLVFVTPSLGGGAVFDQRDHQVMILGNSSGAPRLDAISSESSFTFRSSAEIVAQSVSSSSDWNWVSADTVHPWNAASFVISVQAASGVSIDIAAVRVVDAADVSAVIFQTDFSHQSSNGWTFANNASFANSGSPPMPSIHLSTIGPNFPSASTTFTIPISSQISRIFVSALVRFQTSPGPFKIGVEWFGSDGSKIGEAIDWGNWSPYYSSPASLIVKLWHPQIQEEARLRFRAFDSVSGELSLELTHTGVIEYNQSIAPYRTGELFHIEADWQRGTFLSFSVQNDTGLSFSWSSASAPASQGLTSLISYSSLALSLLPQGAGLNTDVILYNPVYVFPGSGRFADFTANAAPLLAAAAILVTLSFLWLREGADLAHRLANRSRSAANREAFSSLKHHYIPIFFLAIVALVYFAVALNFGGHPFDNIVFKSWVYGGQNGGLQGIYGHSSSVGDSFVRGDESPWSSLGFGYEPLAAYLMLAISSLLPSLGTLATETAMFGSATLEANVKWLLGLFTLATSAAIYVVVLKSTADQKRALLAMAIFALNPAIVFDSVVWGETDSLLYLAFLAFAIFATKRPTLATITFLLALGVKQTGIILLLPTVFLLVQPGRKISGPLASIGKASSVFFVALIPLTVGGVLPTALLKPLVSKLQDIGGSIVSPDTYTVWTSFTPFGASGAQQLQFPSNIPVLGPLSFAVLGYATFSIIMLSVLFLATKTHRLLRPGFWYAVVALAAVVFTAVLTGAASRYYTLAIPTLTCALALEWDHASKKTRAAGVISLISISAVSIWTMAGLFTTIMSREFPDIRGLQVGENPFMALVGRFYLQPLIILVGSAAVIGVVILLTLLVLKLSEPGSPPTTGRSLVKSTVTSMCQDSSQLANIRIS